MRSCRVNNLREPAVVVGGHEHKPASAETAAKAFDRRQKERQAIADKYEEALEASDVLQEQPWTKKRKIGWIECHYGAAPPGREAILRAFRRVEGKIRGLNDKSIRKVLSDARFTKNKGGRPPK
jgi:hypothetical protein